MQNWFGQQPNWVVEIVISGVVGAVLGVALPSLYRAARLKLTVKQRSFLYGKWFCYYFSTENGEQVLKSERWHITPSLRFHLALETESLVEPFIKYKGHMSIENNNVLVEMESASDHKEKVYMRFPYSQAQINGPIVGLGIQYDYDDCTEATVNVLSQGKMDKQSFRELVKNRVVVLPDHIMLRCPRPDKKPGQQAAFITPSD